MASKMRKSFTCPHCPERGELSNRSRHIKIKHPEHYTPRADIHGQTSQARWNADKTEETSEHLITSILSILPSESLRAKIQAIGWKSLKTLEKSDLSIWDDSTTTIPRIFRTRECWYPDVPRYEDIFNLVFDTIEKFPAKSGKYVIRDNGGDHGKLSEAMRQIFLQQNSSNPTSVLLLDAKAGNHEIRLPAEPPLLTSRLYGSPKAIFAPIHAFIDLQMDYGADVLATVLGDCKRFWFLFPPTDLNLQLYLNQKNVSNRFNLCVPELEGGIIAQTTCDETLHLPAGTLYAVLTTRPGLMISQSLISTESLRMTAKYLAGELRTSILHEDELTSSIDVFLTNLEAALKSSNTEQIEKAIESWLTCVNSIKEIMDDVGCKYVLTLKEMRERIHTIWHDKSIVVALDITMNHCFACGSIPAGAGFTEHFLQFHYI